jgi:hypothetical protein
VNKSLTRTFLLLLVGATPLARAAAQQPTAGSTIRDMIIEDSLTPAKAQLRDYIAQLRDTLDLVGAVHARLTRARASGMTSVFISQGQQLARRCESGAAMIEVTLKRLEPMHTSEARGDQSLQTYRAGLGDLHENLRQCAHFDSLTLASKPLDQEKLENISTAASDSVLRYDQVRDALLKLLGISLPIEGKIFH